MHPAPSSLTRPPPALPPPTLHPQPCTRRCASRSTASIRRRHRTARASSCGAARLLTPALAPTLALTLTLTRRGTALAARVRDKYFGGRGGSGGSGGGSGSPVQVLTLTLTVALTLTLTGAGPRRVLAYYLVRLTLPIYHHSAAARAGPRRVPDCRGRPAAVLGACVTAIAFVGLRDAPSMIERVQIGSQISRCLGRMP